MGDKSNRGGLYLVETKQSVRRKPMDMEDIPGCRKQIRDEFLFCGQRISQISRRWGHSSLDIQRVLRREWLEEHFAPPAQAKRAA